ncbi:MAG TPA: NUDIX hydrolase, partial [Gemmataceae bacterium]|nr:NUDIX hydrolase [Gemmataceae bacterium]
VRRMRNARGEAAIRPWKSLGRQVLLARRPWFEVIRERVELPTGRILDDYYRIVLPDFAMVVPVTPGGEVLMVRGYKHGLGRINLSPPAGLLEPGEEPLGCARRELMEETGHASDDWSALGRFVVDGNRQCGTMHLFVARDVRPVRPPREDELEELSLERMAPARVLEALRRGEVGNLAGAGGVALALVLALQELIGPTGPQVERTT